jgi:methyltransferase
VPPFVSFVTFASFVSVFGFMIVEARRAARNEAAQRARGGLEPSGDVYKMMRVAYPAAFLAMLVEGAWRGTMGGSLVVAGAIVFALAKALKWWAIVSLGPFWTFRVIVIPNAPRVVKGPYRWLNHPNYVGVAGEFVGVALMTRAWVSAAVTAIVWTVLLRKRIDVETSALAGRLN